VGLHCIGMVFELDGEPRVVIAQLSLEVQTVLNEKDLAFGKKFMQNNFGC
jgi:hypothetical protein